jgi:hypothetical protein
MCVENHALGSVAHPPPADEVAKSVVFTTAESPLETPEGLELFSASAVNAWRGLLRRLSMMRLVAGIRTRRLRIDRVYGVAAFRALVERERERAARGNHPFAVLVFPLPGGDLRQAIRDLDSEVRATDAVGRAGPEALGVVLRHVDREAALRVAEILCARLETHTLRPRCTVYPFPPELAVRGEAQRPLRGNRPSRTRRLGIS